MVQLGIIIKLVILLIKERGSPWFKMKTCNRVLSNKSIDNSQINSNPCLKEPLLYYSNELMKCSTIFHRRNIQRRMSGG
jgi:hypothetical protein